MTPAAKAITITCPNCSNSLDGFDIRPGMQRLCPFCGTSFTAADSNMSLSHAVMPDRVIPFTTDRKDFEREVIKCLTRHENIPPELFNMLSFLHAEGIYFPVYIFEGQYEPSGEDAGTSLWRKWFRPGRDAGDGFSILSPAAPEPDLIIEYQGKYLSGDSDISDSRIFSYNLMEERMFIPSSLSAGDSWRQYGPEEVSGHNKNETKKPEDIAAFLPEKNGKLLFLPFWMATVEYSGHRLRFVMDGTDCSSIKEVIPSGMRSDEPLLHMRQASRAIQVSAWLSLILLFWNIWWLPVTLWGAWFISCGLVLIYRTISARKNRKPGK